MELQFTFFHDSFTSSHAGIDGSMWARWALPRPFLYIHDFFPKNKYKYQSGARRALPRPLLYIHLFYFNEK
jgi:hypothetical protein